MNINDFHVSQASRISDRNAKADELRNTLQELKKKQNELLAAQQLGSENISSLQSDYDLLVSNSETLRNDLIALETNIFKNAQSFYSNTNEDFTNIVDSLSSENPIVFFPVRLETKFRVQNDTKTLDIRIYPDTVMIQTHEHLLTENELNSGKEYWEKVWINESTIPTEQSKIDAWDILVKTYGKERSAWIRKQTTPTNISDIETSYSIPTFPTLNTNAESWTEQPYTRMLPDRFVVVAYPNDAKGVKMDPIIQVGNLIPEKVKIGISPNFDTEGVYYDNDGNQIVADDSSRWMIDFEQDEKYSAVAVGLGIKLPLTATASETRETFDVSAGFSKIFVWGIKTSLNETDSQVLIEDLIDNHHYTNGFSILKQGTSTKNLTNERAGFNSKEFDPENSFSRECKENLFTPVDDYASKTDGQILAEALGLSYDKLNHIENSDGMDIRNASQMNNVMWAAGTGFYMSDMMDPLFTSDDIRKTRDFYTNFMSSRGAIPSFRVGTLPYGILPISSNKDLTWHEWEPNKDFYDRYNTFINKIDTYWKVNAIRPENSRNIVDNITKTLGKGALSTERYVRAGAGPELVWNSLMFDNRQVEAARWHGNMEKGALLVLTELGFSSTVIPKVLKLSFSQNEVKSNINLVAEHVSNQGLNKLEASDFNFIQLLLNCNLSELIHENYGEHGINKPINSLLYKSLRMSLLTEYWNFAADYFRLSKEERKLTEFFNDGTDLYDGKPLGDADLKIGRNRISYLLDPEFMHIIDMGGYVNYDYGNNITKVRNDLNSLSTLTSKELEILHSEHLDINTHRIDSWTMGPIIQRLMYIRNTLPGTPYSERKTGSYIGAYGWLTDVKDLQSNTTQQTNKFMLAPSINQAITAALLRNGYDMSNNFVSSELSAVNLTSERVREALFIIDGIMKGNSLGELLGYQFETELKKNIDLIEYIDDIRKQFLFSEVVTRSGYEALNEFKARGVVNGLKILQKFQETGGIFDQIFGNSITDNDHQNLILDIVNKISTIMDALGDLIVAEGVFQIVQGNYERAGALSEAFSNGQTPVFPEVIDIQRNGFNITNKVMLNMEVYNFDQLRDRVYGGGIILSARQLANPSLDAWLHTLLGQNTLNNVICNVDYIFDGNRNRNIIISLSDLQLYPIDCLYIFGNQGSEAELNERIYWYVKTHSPSSTVSDIKINFEYKTASKYSFSDFQGFMRQIFKVVSQSTFLKTSDYSWEYNSLSDIYDFDDIRLRMQYLVNRFFEKTNILKNALTDRILIPLASALYDMSQFGLSYTLNHPVNISSPVIDENKLLADTQLVMQIVVSRKDKINELYDQLLIEDKIELAIELSKLILGDDFNFIPNYDLGESYYSIKSSINSSSLLDDAKNTDSDMAMEEWVHDVSKVRGKVADFELMGIMKDCFNLTGLNFDFAPIQLPYDPNDPITNSDNNRWMGLEVDPSRMKSGKLCIAVTSYDTFDQDVNERKKLCGFLLDEWTEIIPQPNHSAALALNYNQPNAQAPQCLLIAVPSSQPYKEKDINLFWRQNDIQAMIEQTLDNAKRRSADFESIKNSALGQFLPLTVFPVTSIGKTSLSFKSSDLIIEQ